MIGWITVQEPDEHQRWLASVPVPTTLAERGEQVFARLGCAECHATGGELAPLLGGVYGSKVKLADGSTVVADDNYLRESILDPEMKIVAGFDDGMSTFRGQVNEEEILALISYLKSLPVETSEATAAAGSVMR